MNTASIAAHPSRRGWTTRLRAAFLVLTALIPLSACVDGVDVIDSAPRAGIARLPLRASYNGPALSTAAINRIRVTVQVEPGGQKFGPFVVDVADAPEWTIPVEFPLATPTNVVVLVELINFANGAETVEFSGRLGPFRAAPGVPQTTPPINVFPGPPDNLDIESLTIGGSASVIEGGSTQLTANVQGGGANTRVTWTSLDPTIASVSPTGLVTTLLPGTARIVAVAGPKSTTLPVTVTRRMARVELAPATRVLNSIGATSSFTARVLDPRNAEFTGVAVEWSSSDPSVAESLGNGSFRAKKPGRVTITATVPGTALTASGSLSVEQTVARIEVRPTAVTLETLAGTASFSAVAFDAGGAQMDGQTFRWSSSNAAVATIDQAGLASARGVGSTVIKAEIGAISATATLDVSQKVVLVEVTPSSVVFNAIGEKQQLTAVAKDGAGNIIAGKTFTWRSTSQNANVDQNGMVTANSRGSAQVMAEVDGVSGSASITVNQSVGRITFNTTSLTLAGPGATAQLTASVRDANGNTIPGKTVTFYSQKPSVATVTSSGLVTGISAGTGAISATVDGFVGTVPVTVGAAPPPTGGAAGGDIVVFNDINVFDNFAMANANNVTLVKNLIDYSSTGARGTAKTVWLDYGRNSGCSFCGSDFTTVTNTVIAAGYTPTVISSTSGSLVSIPANVKVIIMWLPTVSFTPAEINALKSFASQGGRIVYVGEHGSFYSQAGFSVENSLLSNLGSGISVTPDFIDCGRQVASATQIRTHQITNGLTTLDYACASKLTLSGGAIGLLYDKGNTIPLIAVGSINTTPVTSIVTVPAAAKVLEPARGKSINPADAVGAGLVPRTRTDDQRK